MTRGILVDLPLMKKVPYLDRGTPVTAADLEAWEKFASVKIRAGDAVFLRTGRWAQRAEKGAVERGAERGRLSRLGDAVAEAARCGAARQ